MAVAFQQGQDVGQGDLDIFLTNQFGAATNAAEISYAIYWLDESGGTPVEVLIGPAVRVPVNPSVGEYYASLSIPAGGDLGTYHIRWTFKETAASPAQGTVQEFAVVNDTTSVAPTLYSTAVQSLINSLRILLRDNDPDRNYRFRPPEHEGDIGQYNQIFGQIWEDYELYEYLQRALDWWNMLPPLTGICNLDTLVLSYPQWRTAVINIAMLYAAWAVAFNWVADEFDYSIGGISLSIERSSKYESMKNNAKDLMQTAMEAKARTTKYIKGLQQPRFGIGIRSAFGPHVGRGILSPRNFI
jgi:hypothetical protein